MSIRARMSVIPVLLLSPGSGRRALHRRGSVRQTTQGRREADGRRQGDSEGHQKESEAIDDAVEGGDDTAPAASASAGTVATMAPAEKKV